MPLDLTGARGEVLRRRRSAEQFLEESLAAGASDANRHSYIRRFDAMAMAAARSVDAQCAAGAPLSALAGLAVSIKDLFDVEGQVTTAGSLVLQGRPPAESDCPAVARLRQAGAALTGHTNMTEFAFSGIGINPHHGTPANAGTARVDPVPRIPGGSSSGAAVTVASGAAWAALGSDTGGSIRIPAALQGIVGFKNTTRLTSTEGAVPLSTTLDTACALTRSVGDAVLLHQVLAQRRVAPMRRPLKAMRLALPTTALLDKLDTHVAAVFERTLSVLRNAGAQIEDIALPEIAELPAMVASGGILAAEAWAWHRELLTTRERDYDPRVAMRIRRGERISAADYIQLLDARSDWIARMTAATEGFDALLSPTVPIVAPPIADLAASDDAFFAANALMLRNTSAVNMLDGCALSLPCHRAGEMPVGLMVWSSALRDDRVLGVSIAIEAALGSKET